MSIKTQIESIRREIQTDKIKPVGAINELTSILGEVHKKIEDGSPELLMYDFFVEYIKLRECQTVKYDSYGHNKQYIDAMIRITGDLLSELDKKITKKKT